MATSPADPPAAAPDEEAPDEEAPDGEAPDTAHDPAVDPDDIVWPAAVVVASNRAAAGVYDDTTGPVLVEALRGLGFEVGDPVVMPDGEPVGYAVQDAVEAGARVVLTTGGTGLTPTDRTPEVVRPLLDYEVPGIAEAVRAVGLAKGVGTAALSRGIAGVMGQCLIVNLPGSRGGVKDGLEALTPLLRHAVAQIGGGDHPQTHSTDQTGGQP